MRDGLTSPKAVWIPYTRHPSHTLVNLFTAAAAQQDKNRKMYSAITGKQLQQIAASSVPDINAETHMAVQNTRTRS